MCTPENINTVGVISSTVVWYIKWYIIFIGMQSEKATVWSKYLRTLKRRKLLNLTLELKVSFHLLLLWLCHAFV